jgi:hypothetical protein
MYILIFISFAVIGIEYLVINKFRKKDIPLFIGIAVLQLILINPILFFSLLLVVSRNNIYGETAKPYFLLVTLLSALISFFIAFIMKKFRLPSKLLIISVIVNAIVLYTFLFYLYSIA